MPCQFQEAFDLSFTLELRNVTFRQLPSAVPQLSNFSKGRSHHTVLCAYSFFNCDKAIEFILNSIRNLTKYHSCESKMR